MWGVCKAFMSRSDSRSLYIGGFITNALFIIDLPSSLCSTILLYHFMIDSALHHILLWSTNPFQHLPSCQMKWNTHYKADFRLFWCRMWINTTKLWIFSVKLKVNGNILLSLIGYCANVLNKFLVQIYFFGFSFVFALLAYF